MSLLALGIAGVRIDLRTADPEPAALGRYHPFAGASGPADWTLELAGTFDRRLLPGRSLVLAGGRWRMSGAEDAAWLDPASRTGAARVDPECLVVDTLVRASVGVAVIAAGGLLLHAASVVVDGAAHLFPAPSGSGKSTLAARAGHPLADELSVLRPAPDGAGYVAHASPWWRSRAGCAPLAALYELAWGDERVTPLAGSALRLLATSLVLPLEAPADWTRALATAAAVARTTRTARLAFRPDSDVDRLLRGAGGRPW